MTRPAGPRLLGPAEVRPLAAALDLRPTKQRGQNFVIDANTVRRIVRESGVGRDDVVVEVGPGLGSLTLALLEVARRVVADRGRPAARRAAAGHHRRVRPGAGRPVRGGARRRDARRPSSPARRRPRWSPTCPTTSRCRCCCTCSPLLPSLERGLVMVQAEVADRLAAAARLQGLRRPVGQGRLVRRRTPRRRHRPQRLLAGAQRRLRPGRLDPPRAARRPRRPASRSSPSSTRPSPSAARRCAARCAELAGSAEAAEAALAAAGVDPMARGEVLDVGDFARIAEGLRPMADPTQPESPRSGAPAKINLHLGVGAPRADGFHPLDTVYQAVGLYDDVTVATPAVDSRRPSPARAHVDVAGVPARRHATSRSAPLGRAARTASTQPARPDRTRGSRSPAAWPAAPPTPRPRWSRCDRLRDLRTARRRAARAGRRARQRRAVRAGRRHRARHRPRRAGRAGRRPRHLVVGRRPGRGRPVDARGLPPASTRCRPTPPPDARRARPAARARWRTGDARPAWPRALHNDLAGGRASTSAPSSREPARGRARPPAPCAALVTGSGPTCVFLCAATARTAPGASPAALGVGCPTVGSGRATARSPAPDVPRERIGRPMANLVNLERVSKAYGVRPLLDRRLARRLAPASGSASSAATATARPRCCEVMTGLEAPDAGRVSRTRGLLDRLPPPGRRARRHPHRPRGGARRPRRPRVGRRPGTREVVEVLLAGVDPRPRRRRALRRRAAALLAGRAAARRPRPGRARRAHQPPRRRGGRLAGRPPRRAAVRAGRRHPRPLVPRRGLPVDVGGPRRGRSTPTRAGTPRSCWPRPSGSGRPRPRRRAGRTWSARSWPGCAAARRPGPRSRSSASTPPTR